MSFWIICRLTSAIAAARVTLPFERPSSASR
jgi:hypothetical protein